MLLICLKTERQQEQADDDGHDDDRQRVVGHHAVHLGHAPAEAVE
jgi:hypothetical protein